MTNITYKIMFGLIGVMFAVVSYNTYQLHWPIKVFENKSLKILTPQVKAGEDVIYHVSYCRYFAGPIHVFKSIEGPSLIYIPETVNSNAPGCREANVHVPTPTTIMPGTYVIKVTAEAQVNQSRKITVRFQTDSFEVK